MLSRGAGLDAFTRLKYACAGGARCWSSTVVVASSRSSKSGDASGGGGRGECAGWQAVVLLLLLLPPGLAMVVLPVAVSVSALETIDNANFGRQCQLQMQRR